MNYKTPLAVSMAALSALAVSAAAVAQTPEPTASPAPTTTAPAPVPTPSVPAPSAPAPSLPVPGLPLPTLPLPTLPPPGEQPEPAPPVGQAEPCVQKISVVNNGGFTMAFQAVSQEQKASPSTESYPINQWRIMDLSTLGFAEKTNIRPLVKADAGKIRGGKYISYCKNGQTASYSVYGTTQNFHVAFMG